MSGTQQENFLSDILQCWCISMASAANKLENLQLPAVNLIDLAILPDSEEASENPLLFQNGLSTDMSVLDFLRGELSVGRRFTLQEYSGMILMVTNLKADADDAAKRYEARTLAELIRDLLQNELGISVSIGISRTHDTTNELGLALVEAVTALMDRIYLEEGSIIHVDDMFSMALIRRSAELSAFIEAANARGAEDTLAAFYHLIRTRIRPDITLVRALFQNLLVQMYQFMRDLPGAAEMAVTEPIEALCRRIESCESPDEIFALVSEYIGSAITRLHRRRFQRHEVFVERAEAFIAENAHRSITLADVTQHIGISQSYFSSIFKQYTGRSFIQYLTDTRVAMAKELLRSPDMKIAEVALHAGFSDTKYFANVFRRQTGTTPSEYRRSLLDRGRKETEWT